jgi:hypothetical protein
MKSSEFNVEMLNNLIDQASSKYECNDECMRDRTANTLLTKYHDAVDAIQTAPQRANDAFKEYVMFTRGETAFNKLNTQRLTKEAHEKGNQLKQKFEKNARNVSQTSHVYTSMFNNFSHVRDLYKKLAIQNKNEQKYISSQTTSALTNDRLAYYSEQNIEQLESYYTVLSYIYWLSIVIFIGLCVKKIATQPVLDKAFIIKYVILGMGVIMYPWLSIWIYNLFRRIFIWIYSFF